MEHAPGMRRRLLIMLGAMLLLPAVPARAVEHKVDFQTGPPLGAPITDEYLGEAFVQWFLADPGFRPGRRAHLKGSGIAADIGANRCEPDGGTGTQCELPLGGTTFQLSRKATSLTLDAGHFTKPPQAVNVQLVAYRAGESQPVASSPVTTLAWDFFAPFGTDQIETPVTVTSAAGDIQRVELVIDGPGKQGADVGFDDLVIDYSADQLPDVALSADTGPSVVYQGTSVDVPLSIIRINGSDGDLTPTVTGLPAGVTAELLPDPVPGTQSTATLRVTAADDAPVSFAPQSVALTLTPADAGVAPGPRTVDVNLSVRSPFELDREGGSFLEVPWCVPTDTKILLNRDVSWAVDHTITLAATSVPAGLKVEFVPSATVPPVGQANTPTFMRLTRSGTDRIPSGATITVEASSPDGPTRVKTWPVINAGPTATLDPTTLRGSVPSRLLPGGLVRLTGNGFCRGTRVQVGNALAEVDTQPDLTAPNTAIYFRVPRLATTGPVTVITPGAPSYPTTGSLTVDSLRNSGAPQFENFGWGNLSYDELTDLVGDEEMFYSPNPCWPFYDCSLPTPIPDPVAFLAWQVIDQAAQSSKGHCFGINRFVQEVAAGQRSPGDLVAGVGRVYDLPSAAGPVGAVGSYLDERHAGQFTFEYLRSFMERTRSLTAQLERARRELAAGRLPGIVVRSGFSGHVITAHDIEELPDGTTVIWAYDNNKPFTPSELDASGTTHRDREESSRVVINAAKTRWEFGSWSGGSQTLYTTLLSDWPTGAAASLPGIEAVLNALIYGSPDGAAVIEGEPANGEVLPVLDSNAIPGSAGTVIATEGPITNRMVGRKDGSYRQTFVSGDFLGTVEAPTSAGVTDSLTGDGRRIAFAGSETRPIEMRLGINSGDGSRLATIETRSASGGSDVAALRSGALVYEHDGPPATVAITLTSATDGKGAGQFESGPLAVRRNETLTITPSSWDTLGSARVVGRSKAGRRVRKVRSRSSLDVRVALRGLSVKAGSARVTTRFSDVPAGAVAGVVLRLVRGKRVVAKRGFGVAQVADGARRFSFKLPALRKGRYTLRADATVTTPSGTRRVSSQVRVRR